MRRKLPKNRNNILKIVARGVRLVYATLRINETRNTIAVINT
jgi:hypothetical protein